MGKIPVILDTDIGGDIDDTWALAMLLNSPEVEVKLVVSDTADTVYRAKILAKLLEVAGRTEIPVGIGLRFPSDGPRERQRAWIEDYDLSRYPGTVYEDGVQAMIDVILGSPEPMTLVCIGPVPNIAAALAREPRIAGNVHYVGMQGSIARQHEDRPGAIAEFNVVRNVPAFQQTFAASWLSRTLTPLDTCGIIRLEGERYARIAASENPLTRAVLENYRIWNDGDSDGRSTILFDTVAVHLAYSTAFLEMRTLGIRVTDDGFTVPDAAAPPANIALAWHNLDGYLDDLTVRILGVR